MVTAILRVRIGASKALPCTTSGRSALSQSRPNARPRRAPVAPHAYSVELQHGAGTTTLEVPDGESILQVAIDSGIDVPHDCKMGVCMNCAAKLISGEVDQNAGMLSDDVKEKGYVLLCCAVPQGEVAVKVIEEEELLAEVMQR